MSNPAGIRECKVIFPPQAAQTLALRVAVHFDWHELVPVALFASGSATLS